MTDTYPPEAYSFVDDVEARPCARRAHRLWAHHRLDAFAASYRRVRCIHCLAPALPPTRPPLPDPPQAELRPPNWMLVLAGWNPEAIDAMRDGWHRTLERMKTG